MSASNMQYQSEPINQEAVARMQASIDAHKDELCLKIAAYLKSNTVINPKTHALLVHILSNHPDWAKKSTNMNRIVIIDNQGIHKFAIERKEGTYEEIDYRKAIYGKEVIDNIKHALMRHISYRVSKFIEHRYQTHTNTCDYCECHLTPDNSSSMFGSPSFQYLAEGFMQQIELPIIHTRISNKSSKVCIASQAIRNAWEEYFEKHGNLLFVCRDCMGKHYYTTK